MALRTPAESRGRGVAAWALAAFGTVAASFWGFWGAVEAFHEGWYSASFIENLAMTVGQYLAPMLAFQASTVVALRRPRIGAALFSAAAVFALAWFRGGSAIVVAGSMTLPLVALAALSWYARAARPRAAAALVIAVPLAVAVVCGSGPAWRVAHRPAGVELGQVLIVGNGLSLLWAPAGPGWPETGVSWHEAVRRARHLDSAGTWLAPGVQDIWRLPTAEEIVRSLVRNGGSAGGVWNTVDGRGVYRVSPDKEPPLWNQYSRVIYWWTATETDALHALRVSYNGHVAPIPKSAERGYLGFRAVRVVRDGRPPPASQ